MCESAINSKVRQISMALEFLGSLRGASDVLRYGRDWTGRRALLVEHATCWMLTQQDE